jgi:hypothetical protein
MSRYEYDGEAAMPYGLWRANVKRAMSSRRGRQALCDLREALLALPEPVLIEGALCSVNPQQRASAYHHEWMRNSARSNFEDMGEGVCAIGAYMWHRKVKAGMDPAEAFDSLPTLLDSESDLHDTAKLAQAEADITYTLAWELAYKNDETFEGMTPEERYTAFLAWIDAELGAPAESAT